MSVKELLFGQPRVEVAITPRLYRAKCLNLEEMKAAVLGSTVRGRGWPLPYFNEQAIFFGADAKYIGSEIDGTTFVKHLEEWRLYSSGQFLFRMRPWEVVDDEWQSTTRARLEKREPRIVESIEGFLSFELLLYTVTEIYLFASRLTAISAYDIDVKIQLRLRGMKQFALACRQPQNTLDNIYMTHSPDIQDNATIFLEELHSKPKACAANALMHLYKQFNWTFPPTAESIAEWQEAYY